MDIIWPLLIFVETNSDQLVHIGGGTALALLIGKEAVNYLRKINHKLDRRNGSHSCATKEDVKEVFNEGLENRVEKYLIEQKTSLTDIRDGINKLVIISELKKGAGI